MNHVELCFSATFSQLSNFPPIVSLPIRSLPVVGAFPGVLEEAFTACHGATPKKSTYTWKNMLYLRPSCFMASKKTKKTHSSTRKRPHMSFPFWADGSRHLRDDNHPGLRHVLFPLVLIPVASAGIPRTWLPKIDHHPWCHYTLRGASPQFCTQAWDGLRMFTHPIPFVEIR